MPSTQYKLPIYNLIDGDVDKMSLVEFPAVEVDFIRFAKENPQPNKTLSPVELRFDDENHNIHGVAILADTPIYRFNLAYGEHYIVFTKELIEKLVLNFFKHHKNQEVNIDHFENAENITIFESFIVSDRTKSEIFPEVPEGSWLVSYNVADEDTYNRIKAGELRGFSIEGLFTYSSEPVSEVEVEREDSLDSFIEDLV